MLHYSARQIAKKITFIVFMLLSVVFVFGQNENTTVPSSANDICPLLDGEKAPQVSLRNIDNENKNLADIIAAKPTLLIFYRGGWCPYCNLHLAELQGIEQKILDLGYQIVAISPDSPEFLKETLTSKKLNYILLSDAPMKAAAAFGIAFNAGERQADRLKKRSENGNPGWLPVPSVFVLNTDGIIQFEYINPDYKTRIKGNLLLAVLGALNAK